MQSKVGETIWNLLAMCLCIFFEEGTYIYIYIYKCLHLCFFFHLIYIWCFSLPLISLASLPWQGLRAGTKKQKYDKISEKKRLTPVEVTSSLFLNSCIEKTCVVLTKYVVSRKGSRIVPYLPKWFILYFNWQVLCKSFPPEFTSYFLYVRSLRFEDKPDYPYLKRLFRDLFIREGWGKVSVFLTFLMCVFFFLIKKKLKNLLLLICRLSVWLCIWLDNLEISAVRL